VNGKGDRPRPLSVTPDTYAANYTRIRWTEDAPQHPDAAWDLTFPCEPLQNATPFGIATPPEDVPATTARDMPTESKVEN
jgi:hypothetical protein